MVAKTALQVPLTCDIPQVASQIERHPAIRCQCAQKRNKGVVSSARPELQLVIGRDKTLCSKFQEILLPKIKPCWWMTGTYIAHCRTLIHAPCTWHFSRSPPTPKLHSTTVLFIARDCRYTDLYSIFSPMPPVPNIGMVMHGMWAPTARGTEMQHISVPSSTPRHWKQSTCEKAQEKTRGSREGQHKFHHSVLTPADICG